MMVNWSLTVRYKIRQKWRHAKRRKFHQQRMRSTLRWSSPCLPRKFCWPQGRRVPWHRCWLKDYWSTSQVKGREFKPFIAYDTKSQYDNREEFHIHEGADTRIHHSVLSSATERSTKEVFRHLSNMSLFSFSILLLVDTSKLTQV